MPALQELDSKPWREAKLKLLLWSRAKFRAIGWELPMAASTVQLPA